MIAAVKDHRIQVPLRFGFQQDFPNQFNPSTEIQFTVPADGRATLKVFNTLGQVVATLFDDRATAGTCQQAQFNGSSLASVIYFARWSMTEEWT
jgi:hypothetical protein